MVEVGQLPWLESRAYSNLAELPDLAYLQTAGQADRMVAVRAHEGSLPIGVAVAFMLDETRARLSTFKIREAYDEPSTRAKLLHSLETELKARGCTIVDYTYYRELNREASLAAIPQDETSTFHAAEWSAGQPASVLLTYSERFCEAPWINANRTARQDLELLPWLKLGVADKEQISRLLEGEPKLATLNPTLLTNPCFGASSFALLHNGRLAGWCVTEQAAPDTLHYASFFVERRLRLTEAPLVLMRAAIRSHFSLKNQFPRALQSIPVGLIPILRFAQNKMVPWADKVEALFVTHKRFTEPIASTDGRSQ